LMAASAAPNPNRSAGSPRSASTAATVARVARASALDRRGRRRSSIPTRVEDRLHRMVGGPRTIFAAVRLRSATARAARSWRAGRLQGLLRRASGARPDTMPRDGGGSCGRL
jgi:uncharacterized protein YPO0396